MINMINMKFKTEIAILLLAIISIFMVFDLFSYSSVGNIIEIGKNACYNVIAKIKALEKKAVDSEYIKWIHILKTHILNGPAKNRKSALEDKNGNGS